MEYLKKYWNIGGSFYVLIFVPILFSHMIVHLFYKDKRCSWCGIDRIWDKNNSIIKNKWHAVRFGSNDSLKINDSIWSKFIHLTLDRLLDNQTHIIIFCIGQFMIFLDQFAVLTCTCLNLNTLNMYNLKFSQTEISDVMSSVARNKQRNYTTKFCLLQTRFHRK